MHAQVHLCNSSNIFLAIGHDPGKVLLRPIYFSNLAAVDIVFWRRHPKGMSQEVERYKTFIFPEFPEFHRVEMGHLPGFFSRKVQYGRQLHSMDDHPAAQIWKIEILSVVGAEEFLTFRPPFVQKVVKTKEQVLFIVAIKRFEKQLPVHGRAGQYAAADADDFPEL